MEKILGKNWRTTLWGFIGGVAVNLYPVFQTMANGAPFDKNALIMGASLAVLGKLSNDAGVTGSEK